MAFPQGIDFRLTSGFVADPAQCDNEISLVVNYPRTSPVQGNQVGWEVVASATLTRDRNTGTPKLAGIYGSANALTADVSTYRIDLPSAGAYDIFMAIGDQASQHTNQTVELFDTTTSLGVILNNADTTAADKYFDATGVLRTSSADWVANNVKLTKTFATTIFRLSLGPNGRAGNTGDNTVIAHLFVQASVAAAGLVLRPKLPFMSPGRI